MVRGEVFVLFPPHGLGHRDTRLHSELKNESFIVAADSIVSGYKPKDHPILSAGWQIPAPIRFH
jgi:hypothetical protein